MLVEKKLKAKEVENRLNNEFDKSMWKGPLSCHLITGWFWVPE